MTDLRPRSVGELLDRAVTLCVRAFVPLTVIAAIGVGAQYTFILVSALFRPGSMGAAFGVLVGGVATLLSAVLLPMALATAVYATNRGEPFGIVGSYRAAMRRLGAALLVSLGYGLVSAIGLGVVGAIVALSGGALAAEIAAVVLMVVPGAYWYLAYAVALTHCVLSLREGGWFPGGMAVFDSGEGGRTTLAALAYAGLSSPPYLAFFGLPELLKRVPGEQWITVAAAVILEVGVALLTAAFITLYYLDMRRRRGLDVVKEARSAEASVVR